MTEMLDIEIVNYRPEYGLETVKMWRQSFQRAMDLEEHNRADELIPQLDYFASLDPQTIQVVIDRSTSVIAGLMVLNLSELDHLYVHVNYQHQGIGLKLLNQAKSQCTEGIELHTFQKNERAQAFYLRHGFVEVERGYANFVGNLWASCQEDLADIKYSWRLNP